MAITLQEFRKLDEEQQLALFLYGIHVGHLSKDGLIYVCKQIYDFYVVFITDGNKYFAMKSHRDTDLLDPFLGKSDLGNIL